MRGSELRRVNAQEQPTALLAAASRAEAALKKLPRKLKPGFFV